MKKEYYIPAIEIIVLGGEKPLMQLAKSKDYWAVPSRRYGEI